MIRTGSFKNDQVAIGGKMIYVPPESGSQISPYVLFSWQVRCCEADNLTLLLVQLVLVILGLATEAVGARAEELGGLQGWLLTDDFKSLDFGAEWNDLHGRVGDDLALAVGVAHEVALARLLLASLAGVVDDNTRWLRPFVDFWKCTAKVKCCSDL